MLAAARASNAGERARRHVVAPANAQVKAARGDLGARGGRDVTTGDAGAALAAGAGPAPAAPPAPAAAAPPPGRSTRGAGAGADARRRPGKAAAVMRKSLAPGPPEECTLDLRRRIAFGTATSAFQVGRGCPPAPPARWGWSTTAAAARPPFLLTLTHAET